MMDFLLSIDTMWIVILILVWFILYQVRSGEVPIRMLGSIRRERTPIFYWLFILFYVVILGIVIYAWIIGVRLPISEMLD